jgi:hypothetical protein
MRLTAVAVLAFLAAGGVMAAEPPLEVSGAVAYTDYFRFDYTKDGVRNRVQFWLEMQGRAEVGRPGEPGYQPAEGFIRYYLKDADRGNKVANWREGLNMTGLPADQPYPMSNLVFEGNTARFEAFGMKWTVTDGGEGFQNDKVIIDDGFKQAVGKFYDGDLRVGPPAAAEPVPVPR